MSMLFGPASSDPAVSGLPRGEVLGTYDSYTDARKVVDRLAEQEFDVRTVSIVGIDLRTVERIRHRQTYASVALRSALQGAVFGLMLGILMSLIDPATAGPQMLYTVGLGVGIWVLFGVIGHAIRKGRGFDSVQQLVPTRFDVVCEFASAPMARQILGGGSPAPSPARAPGPTTAQQPPSAASADPVTGTGSSVPAGPASPTAPPPATARARTHLFPDLPDGRPQYGVRLPEDQAQALRERMLQDQPGAAPGTFAAPDYGRHAERPTTESDSGSGTEEPARDDPA